MLTHKGTKTIITERLILRKFRVDDATDMFNNWASDENVTRFLTWKPHESVDATKQLLEGWVAAYDNEKTYNWIIEYKGQAIGSISVVRLSDKCEYAELGYCLGCDYWNKGIMSEAANAVIDYLFAEIGVNRVGISHATENPGSGKVAQKCGMFYEGTKREYFKTSIGKFVDIVDYGITRSDWERKDKSKSNTDIVIQTNKTRFGLRTVGVMVRDGKILVQREKDGTEYALPGGAVQMLETTEEALVREYKEETGADIEIKHLLWTEEDFWNYKGRRHHGLAYYYLIDFCDGSDIPETEEFISQKDDCNVVLGWMPIDKLKDITIYPTFLKDEIYNLNGELKHFISKE